MKRLIAIPSDGTELRDPISEHFGHCNYFIGIEVDKNNNYRKIFSLQNNGHFGCMEPVINMVRQNVTDMIVGGIGGRPYMGFIQYNINLFKGINGSLKDNIEFLLQNRLDPLKGPMCKGH
ncbi:MAG: NifB/NifX family molybdenum-iron cluster-binding protein [Promethearchaeota archaeon]